jgi:hypothetical protein
LLRFVFVVALAFLTFIFTKAPFFLQL